MLSWYDVGLLQYSIGDNVKVGFGVSTPSRINLIFSEFVKFSIFNTTFEPLSFTTVIKLYG